MKKKKKWIVVKEFEYDVTTSWEEGNPYTIAFCRAPNRENFVIKGGIKEVEALLKTKPFPILASLAYFHHGNTHNSVRLYNSKYDVFNFSVPPGEKPKFTFYKRKYPRVLEVLFKTRRLPYKFPVELV